MAFKEGQLVLVKNPGTDLLGTIVKDRPGNVGQPEDKMIYEVQLKTRYYRSADLESAEEKADKPKRYSAEWSDALKRFLTAGQQLQANPQDRAALSALSKAGHKLGWIVPIEK